MSRPPWIGELRALLRLAAPAMVTELGGVAMGLVDAAFLGRVGPTALAAAAAGNALFWTSSLFFVGVLLGVEPRIAGAHARGEPEEVARWFSQALWVALLGGLGIALLGVLGAPLLRALGQPEEVAAEAGRYLGALAPSGLPFLLFAAHRVLLYGMARTREVMVVTLVANVVNALLDGLLVFGAGPVPALGVVGAGWATTGCRAFMLLAVALLCRGPGLRPLDLRWRRPDAARLRQVASLGAPVGAQIVAEAGAFGAVTLAVGWLGTRPLASHEVALTLATFTFMAPLGLSSAAAVRVAAHLGRGDAEAARAAGACALGVAAAMMSASATVFLTLPHLAARVVTDEPALIAGAAPLLGVAGVFQVFDGLQVVAAGCLRGAGDTRTPLLANLLAYWVLALPLGLALAFGAGWGAVGLWSGLLVALALVGVALTTHFLRGRWGALPQRSSSSPSS